MTTILVIAHTPLATALQSCVRHILPQDADQILALDVEAHQSPEEIFAAAKLMTHDASELLVLTDILARPPLIRRVVWLMMVAAKCSLASIYRCFCVRFTTGMSHSKALLQKPLRVAHWVSSK